MWFLFGLVTLTLMVWAAYMMRRTSRWSGQSNHYQTPDGNKRWYSCDEQTHKGRKLGYRLGIAANLGFEFQLRAESTLDRVGKSFGIGAEQSVGDAQFDAEIFIDSDDQRVGAALERSEDARNAIRALFRICKQRGATLKRVQAFGGRLWIEVKDSSGLPARPVASEIADALHTINEALTVEARGLHRASDPFLRRAMLILAVSTGLAAFGLLSLLRLPATRLDLDAESLWAGSIVAGVVMCFAGSLLAMKWLRASSRSHRVLAELLTVGLMGSILSVHGLAAEINREWDQSDAMVFTEVPADIFRESYACGKRGRNTCYRYKILFEEGDWPGAAREFRIDLGLYNQLDQETRVDVELMPGLLGCRWIRSLTASSPER